MSSAHYYIGLMSGTSMDAVDAVLGQFGPQQPPTFCAAASAPLPAALKSELLRLNHSGPDELMRAARAAQQLVAIYQQAVHQLLQDTQLTPQAIAAVGAHGQTVRHHPHEGISIQINAPALLAERCHIDVIADFRSRDLAAGGQGAPLVPPFHQLLFATDRPRGVLNIGGIANLTLLRPDQPPKGFDTGPGNILMDYWIHRQQGLAFDRDGAWAAGGQPKPALLQQLLSEPWLAQPPPKSTGRDLFNPHWLQQQFNALPAPLPEQLADHCPPELAQNIQATLLELTAQTISQAIERWAPDIHDLILCGGGAYNRQLHQRLDQLLQRPVRRSTELGIDPQHIEAFAFAWLAYAYDQKICAGHPEVTGAHRATLLGARYYA